MFLKQKEHKISWLQLVIVFILGILIASNGFLLWNNISLQKEINKLKADDIALATAFNNLINQISANKTVPTNVPLPK